MSIVHIGADKGETAGAPLFVSTSGANPSGPQAYTFLFGATSTPLAGGAVYTGSAQLLGQFYKTVTAMAFSDVASAAGGFHLQVSLDGTNWHDCATPVLVAAGVAASISFPNNYSCYYRILYTNGAGAQARFYAAIVGTDC